jgi:C1A family cysteine protease
MFNMINNQPDNESMIFPIPFLGQGMGWITDNPDQRDYNLQEDFRLTREDGTDAIEKLAEELITVLEKLDENIKRADLDQVIDNFRNKTLGDHKFVDVKIHKQLRIGDKEEFVLDLKSFLYSLVKSKKLQGLQNSRVKHDSDNIKSEFEWLKDKEFDQTTKDLVQEFQCLYDIVIDGIVGIETYTAFAEFENKFEFPSIKRDCKNLNDDILAYPSDYKPKTKIEPIFSFLPYEEIFLIIQEKARHQLEKEVFERKAFNSLQNDFFKNQEPLNHLLDNTLSWNEKYIQDFIIENYCGDKGFHNGANFLKINSSILVEPIASVALRKMMPLARYTNHGLTDLIRESFKIFEKNLEKLDSIPGLTSKFDKSTENETALNSIQRDVIVYVWELLKNEINYLFFVSTSSEQNRDKKSKEELRENQYFLLIFEKFIKFYGETYGIKLEEDPKILNAFQFRKKDSFEILNLGNRSSIDSKSTGKSIFFRSLQLKVPILNSRIHTINQELSKDKNSSLKVFLMLPTVVDLSYWCSAIKDQGNLNSCTAFAAIALLEYFTNLSQGKYIDVSPLFLYKISRNLMSLRGDVGSSLRVTMKAMADFGVAPESYWPYDESKIDDEPPQFCYALAQKYQSLKYFRLDYANLDKDILLFQIKAVLAGGFPCAFGLTLYDSVSKNGNSKHGYIPVPEPKDCVLGGHALVAVGYDDYKLVGKYIGALLIRNSKGTEWGKKGYGWLPYEYILRGLTADWWSLLKAEWLTGSSLGLGNIGGNKPQKPF